MKQFFIFSGILLVLLSCYNEKGNVESEVIDINKVAVDGGLISGVSTSDSTVSIFKGIPYAAPPVKNLRWKEPAAILPWEGVKKCNAFGPSAMQMDPQPFYMWSSEFLIPQKPMDEDCLYLNVWTPAKSIDDKIPVVVWIHGGGFSSGGSAVPIYDGEAMARKGVLFVSVNYRVGIFGFYAHPELTAESAHSNSGNYGLLDQIAALQWIQKNIEAFGGDPENVTIAGQSAGAMSVTALVASPLTEGLFQKAIAQSGAGLLKWSPEPASKAVISLTEAEVRGVQVMSDKHLSSISELRELSARELLDIQFTPRPIIDGYVLTHSLGKTFEENKHQDISLLTGWNEDDGILMGTPLTTIAFQQHIQKQWGKEGDTLLQYYPATNDSIAIISQKKLQRDIVFGAQNYTLANEVSGHGKEVFVYRFTRGVPPGSYQDFGAFHTAEVPYAYHNLTFVDRPFTYIDRLLEEVMSDYWINFIKTGNPNATGLPEWPHYTTDTKKIMILGDTQKEDTIRDTLGLNFLVTHLKSE